jgi:hypothetical protein
LSREVFDLVLESSDETEDGFESLVVKPTNGGMAKNGSPLRRNEIRSSRERTIEGKCDARITLLCPLFIAT